MNELPDSSFLFNARGKARAAYYAKQAPPTCSACGKTAIFRVGTKGYCRAHKSLAEAHGRHNAGSRHFD